jgi:hypothetical protein
MRVAKTLLDYQQENLVEITTAKLPKIEIIPFDHCTH